MNLGDPEMAPDFRDEGSYAPLVLPRPQHSARPGEAEARLGNACPW